MTVLNVSIANKESKSVEQGGNSESLIEELLSTDHSSWESRLYVTEGFLDEVDEGWLPPHEVTLAVDPDSGYGALRWVGVTVEDTGPYITLSSEEEPEVDLLRDGDAPYYFPRSAAIPVSGIRKALLEFVSTGKRPECVQWQEFDRI